MPQLADLQKSFGRAVLTGAAPALAFAPGCIPASVAMQVHRNTVMGALANALRLSHPTVDALVGAEFFDHVASLFAEAHPPVRARLAGYGEGFAEFLSGHVPSLPYLGDVARLDWAIDQALLAPATTRTFALEQTVSLGLPASLCLLRLDYPADLIRDALGDDAALAAIDMTPTPRALLVWRSGRQAMLRAVSAPAAAFVEALLSGAGAAASLAAAIAQAPGAPGLIQAEIFAASFCTIMSKDETP
jgi:hypothetical protein